LRSLKNAVGITVVPGAVISCWHNKNPGSPVHILIKVTTLSEKSKDNKLRENGKQQSCYEFLAFKGKSANQRSSARMEQRAFGAAALKIT
jgi:hypothetical protein